ncbi:unnamed protein product, partial [Amoebophrya sp. A25]
EILVEPTRPWTTPGGPLEVTTSDAPEGDTPNTTKVKTDAQWQLDKAKQEHRLLLNKRAKRDRLDESKAFGDRAFRYSMRDTSDIDDAHQKIVDNRYRHVETRVKRHKSRPAGAWRLRNVEYDRGGMHVDVQVLGEQMVRGRNGLLKRANNYDVNSGSGELGVGGAARSPGGSIMSYLKKEDGGHLHSLQEGSSMQELSCLREEQSKVSSTGPGGISSTSPYLKTPGEQPPRRRYASPLLPGLMRKTEDAEEERVGDALYIVDAEGESA